MVETRQEYLKTLRGVPVILRALLRGRSEEGLRRRPEPGEWAAVEVVAHLADVEERALGRVRRMLEEDHPWLEPFDQDELARRRGYLDLPLAPELERFERLRREHVALVEGLDERGWQRTGRHGELGEVTVETYEAHVVNEEVDHLAQIARLVSSPTDPPGGTPGRPGGPGTPPPAAPRA